MSDENRSESSSNIPLYIILILRYKVFYIFRKQDSAKVGVNHEVEKSKLQSECMKLITQLRLFNRAAVKPFPFITLGVMILSPVKIQETQDRQSKPEKEQRTACQDLSYLISVQARRTFPPVLPVKQCCQATSAARPAVDPHAKE